jgi:hypothetical protein
VALDMRYRVAIKTRNPRQPIDAVVAAAAALILPTVFGCGGNMDEDMCSYVSVPGTITISSIGAPGPHESVCSNDPRLVSFKFAADSDAPLSVPSIFTGCPTTASSYGCMSIRNAEVLIGSGEDPPNSCLAPLGIVVGARLPTTLMLETRGCCTPVVFKYAADLSNCEAQCYR